MKKIYKNKKFITLIALTLFILLTIYCFIVFNIKKMPYNDFINLVNDNKIQLVKINLNDSKMIVKTSENKKFKVENPKSENFKEFLLRQGIDVHDSGVNLNIILIIISALTFICIFMFTIGTINKSAGVLVSRTNTSLDDVVGIDEIKNDIINTVELFKNKKHLSKIGIKPTNGIILYGDPGVGKTMLAKAIANYGNMNFISSSGSDFVELFVGMGARKIRRLFATAREKSPCVLFIDEIDAVGMKRNIEGSNCERDQTINALLAELDGFADNDGVLVICATNRIDILDEALIRPGRFDKHIYIPMPKLNARKQLIRKNLENKQVSDDVSIDVLAHITSGMSGAKISHLINQAAILTYISGRNCLTMNDIDESFSKIITNGVKSTTSNDTNLKVAAYHEAGHAICAKLLCKNQIYKISVESYSGISGGFTISFPQESEKLKTKSDLINDIAMIYGGLVAEEIIFGEMSQGSVSDIDKATKTIHDMIDSFGMGEYKIKYENDNDSSIKQVEHLSKMAYDLAKNTVLNNIDLLDKIASNLIIKNSILVEDIERLFI